MLADSTDYQSAEEELDQFNIHVSRHRPEELTKLMKTTKFTRKEIQLIYRGFKQECPTGMVDEDSFKHIFSQFFPQGEQLAAEHIDHSLRAKIEANIMRVNENFQVLRDIDKSIFEAMLEDENVTDEQLEEEALGASEYEFEKNEVQALYNARKSKSKFVSSRWWEGPKWFMGNENNWPPREIPEIDESDNPMIRASRALTDKVSEVMGGLFQKT
ncbi:hypothetical protein GE061_006125 [Apolygus lucorum]|uniref:Uncharacterized protein n=1 Tax=Apolygus lucorum TaxID=248454 RepID=A0A8S9WT32_APOLU|nr:hypothetical protein GE061_006125 [Apolygus lucorum]